MVRNAEVIWEVETHGTAKKEQLKKKRDSANKSRMDNANPTRTV